MKGIDWHFCIIQNCMSFLLLDLMLYISVYNNYFLFIRQLVFIQEIYVIDKYLNTKISVNEMERLVFHLGIIRHCRLTSIYLFFINNIE